MADSARALGAFVAAMEVGRAENGPDGYGSTLLMPLFDPSTAKGGLPYYDYAQSHYWDTSEDKAQGMSN